MIRRATQQDARPMMEIYNQAVADRVYANCDNQTDVDEFGRLYAIGDGRYGAFVAVSHGRMTGWGALKPFSMRPYDDAMAEVALYVDRENRSLGVGIRLLSHMMQYAEDARFHSVVAVVARKNTGSIRCGEFCGFEERVSLPGVSVLLGVAEDMIWMQKVLDRDVSGASRAVRRRRAEGLVPSSGGTVQMQRPVQPTTNSPTFEKHTAS